MEKILKFLIFASVLLFVITGKPSYIREYQVININLRSLSSSDGNIQSHLSFGAYGKHFVFILRKLEYGSGLHGNFKLLDSNNNDISQQYISNVDYYVAYKLGSDSPQGSFTINNDDGTIMGDFYYQDETYFIENTDDNLTIIYKDSDVIADLLFDNDINKNHVLVPECLVKQKYFEKLIRPKRNVRERVKKNRCEIKLVADYEFYKVIGNKNYHKAARHLINVVERVNKLLGAVDFGINGAGERLINLGLVIKEIKIYDRPTVSHDDEFHFNMEYPKRPNDMFWANDSLLSFSKNEKINSTCASVLLTAKHLADGILGLASVGVPELPIGICSDPIEGVYHNTAIVTVKKNEGLLITRIFDLVFAHEMGHLWGSPHDVENCVAENYSGGRFIMHYSSNTGYDQNNYRFSNCSIHHMWRKLYAVQPTCFVEEQKSLCGNGILEPGEECDYGGRYADSGSVNIHDTCCTLECKLRPGALCSPRHEDCCSETCDYLPSTHVCSRRNPDSCQDDAYCSGKSAKCPKPPFIDDEIPCNDEGTCLNGTCHSYCSMNSPGSMPCICENLSDSCFRCCKAGEHGKCKALVPKKPLKDGSICFYGQCRKNVCEKEVTDIATHYWKLIKSINHTPGRKFLGEYSVFLVILVTLLVWCPCSYFIHKKDVKIVAVAEENRSQSVEIVHGPKRIIRQNAISDTTPNAQESTA